MTIGDTEMEAGCGIVPITYKDKSLVHALQWAIGLEWYLLMNDPWRIAMSTDHPNGGSFLAYPQIVQLLMDRSYRQDMLKRVHPRVDEPVEPHRRAARADHRHDDPQDDAPGDWRVLRGEERAGERKRQREHRMADTHERGVRSEFWNEHGCHASIHRN